MCEGVKGMNQKMRERTITSQGTFIKLLQIFIFIQVTQPPLVAQNVKRSFLVVLETRTLANLIVEIGNQERTKNTEDR